MAFVSSAPVADFGRVASFYDALAGLVFGQAQRRAQQAALQTGLPLAGPGPRVLLLGGGPGWALVELLRQCPAARVLYLETSAAMLARAEARLRRQLPAAVAQVEFRLGSEQALRSAEQFDVIATFFVLDCFTAEELPAALARLQAARRPGAPWLVADFRPPQVWWQRALLRTMYLFFGVAVGLRVQQLPPWPAALRAIGLEITYQSSHYGDFILSQVLR
ncbi:MAG: class I SAM-dependent methyltransferase [Janthinobacterium lividum]